MPVGNLPGWRQVFADNFANDDVPLGSFSGCLRGATLLASHCAGLPASVDAKWWAYPDGWSGTPATGTYFPSQTLSIQNGVMDYFIHTATVGGRTYHMIDATMPKIPGGVGSRGGLLYGRYIVRARLDPLHGYHASFLLWPDSNVWPPEIDWPEGDFDSTASAFLHWQSGLSAIQRDAYPTGVSMSAWHTYEIDWTAAGCEFYLDGQLVGDTIGATSPDTPMHWVLQTGVSRQEGTPSNAIAGNVQIDWVVAYVPS
jgi:beta-glucanase (GH16 family)